MANEMANGNGAALKPFNPKPWPVNTIVMHIRPHFDEVLAVYLLKQYSERIFPGIGEAVVETWTEGRMLQDFAGKNADELLLEQQMLFIGTCGGIFDEHGKKSPTCAHLVAEYLGIEDRPELSRILKFCKRVDHDGLSMPFDLHSTMNDMYNFYGDGDEGMQQVFDWATQAIASHIYGQKQFLICAEDFKKTGRIINGGPVKIALVESDNPKMVKWVRFVHDDPGIIAVRRSSGNISIMTSPKKTIKAIDMRDVVRIIRMMELEKRGLSIPSWQSLEAPDELSGCPWWYYYQNGGLLFNGTPTAPDVQPSKLPLDKIAQAIAIACGPAIDPCKAGKCYSSCQKFAFGLIACRRRRFELKKGDK